MSRLPQGGVPLSILGGARGRIARPEALSVDGRAMGRRRLFRMAFTLQKDLADRTGTMVKSRSLSWLLAVSTLVIVLPLVVFALIMVGWIAHDEHEAEKKQLIGDAYAFADTVGREINAYFLLSAALSHSKLLQRGDLTDFTALARDTLAEAPGVKLVVSTADGDPVLSLPPEPSELAALAQSSGARSAGVQKGLRLSFGRRRRPCLA